MPLIAGTAQLVLLAYYAFTHWVPMKGFNDLRFENRSANAYTQILMAVLAVSTLLGHTVETWIAAAWYTLWMVGHLTSWWTPYLTGWPRAAMDANKQRAYTFLPRIKDRVTPDAMHTVLGAISVVVLVTTWRAALA